MTFSFSKKLAIFFSALVGGVSVSCVVLLAAKFAVRMYTGVEISADKMGSAPTMFVMIIIAVLTVIVASSIKSFLYRLYDVPRLPEKEKEMS